MRKRKYILICLFGIGLTGGFYCCEKTDNGNQEQTKGVDTTQPPSRTIVTATLPPEKTNAQPENIISLSPSPTTALTTPQPRVITDESELFAYYPQQRFVTEDFKIGPLHDELLGPLDFLQAGETAGQFMQSIIRKDPDFSLVGADVREQLKAAVSYPLAQGYVPERYRLGKMAFESDDEVRANIRFYKGNAVTEGEIYVKKIGVQWFVSDLQVGFTLLNRKYEKPQEPFMPGSFKFLLED